MKIKLYIEGGGDGPNLDSLFREGWNSFFNRAGMERGKLTVIRGKGRSRTLDLYERAVDTRRSGELPLLLVDSEDLVADGAAEWAHLKMSAAWDRPSRSGNDDAFLMVCSMETWFLADREALKKFFRNCWRDNAMPHWPKLEEVPKASILQALNQATATCGKRAYAKGKLSFEIMKVIDPAIVEAKCPGAKRLLDRLRTN